MERDQEVERIIREKIRTAEDHPAVWDRSLVRAGLLFNRRSNLKPYYMAASVALAMFLALAAWQWTSQLALQVRLGELQLEIEKQSAQMSQQTPPLLTAEDCPAQTTLPAGLSSKTALHPTVTIVRVDTVRIPVYIAQHEPESQTTEGPIPSVARKEVKRPEAILGGAQLSVANNNDKKIRLLVFRGDEPEVIRESADEPIVLNTKNQ